MDKPRFRVSAVDLAESDERALKVFLRFVGNTDHSIWEWSADEECDLVLTGKELPRPLHVDDFSALLRKVEAGFSETQPQDIAELAHAAAGRPPAKQADIPAAKMMEKAGWRSSDIPLPKVQVIEAPRQARPGRDGRYRLARWPKSEFLRGRARATRFLSFLASGYLTVQQLCTLSGADRKTCEALLDALEAAGYLEVKQAPEGKPPGPATMPTLETIVARASPVAAPSLATSSPAPRAITPVAARAGAAASPSGLLDRLKRRLGLG